MHVVFILTSLLASIVGSICGVGGGIIIKPVLDAFGVYPVETISFMSGCIVLSMTSYSMARTAFSHEKESDCKKSVWIGIGAAVGGVGGKQLFSLLAAMTPNADRVGATQAAVLFIITLGTAVYTVNRERIRAMCLTGGPVCFSIGFSLGLLSAFLGIGGGPMNLIVLYYFFSMEPKEAVNHSLSIIFFSQAASLLFTLAVGGVPEFPAGVFTIMVICGILGGIIGRKIGRKIDNRTTSKVFVSLLIVIMGLCLYNFVKFRA